jgi:GNAT superfamily N-acetyltransferase
VLARDPLELFKVAKAIDGYHEENSFILTAYRVDAFYWEKSRQLFYELTTSYDEILGAVRLNAHLLELGVPRTAMQLISVGIPFFPSGFDAEKGRLPLPRPFEPEVGGHCVFPMGWDDGGETLSFPNTWGPEWGDGGTGYLTREYMDKLLREAWVGWDARYGLSAHKNAEFAAARDRDDDEAFKRLWLMEKKPHRVWYRHRGKKVRFRRFDTVSLGGRYAEVLEIRDRLGVLIAWAHLFYGRLYPRTLEVREFFVWPTFRRLGYGTLLWARVVKRAQDWEATGIEANVYQPDALPVFQQGLRAFLQKVGLTWRWNLCERPVHVAIATKELRPAD